MPAQTNVDASGRFRPEVGVGHGTDAEHRQLERHVGVRVGWRPKAVRILDVSVDAWRYAVNEPKFWRDVGLFEVGRLVIGVIFQVHGIDVGLQLVTIGAQGRNDGPALADRYRVFHEDGRFRGVADRKIAQREHLAEQYVGLLARGQVRGQAVAPFLRPALAVLGTDAEPVRDVGAGKALPQVKFEAANLLVVGKEAVDRYGYAGGRAFVQRVLVDFGLLVKQPQHAAVDTTFRRTELVGEVDDIQVLVIVTFERCRRAITPRAEHGLHIGQRPACLADDAGTQAMAESIVGREFEQRSLALVIARIEHLRDCCRIHLVAFAPAEAREESEGSVPQRKHGLAVRAVVRPSPGAEHVGADTATRDIGGIRRAHRDDAADGRTAVER